MRTIRKEVVGQCRKVKPLYTYLTECGSCIISLDNLGFKISNSKQKTHRGQHLLIVDTRAIYPTSVMRHNNIFDLLNIFLNLQWNAAS